MKRLFFIIAFIVVLVVGGYIWRISDTGRGSMRVVSPKQTTHSTDIIVIIGGSPIYYKDLEWAYNFDILGLNDREELSFFPEVGDNLHELLAPLKDRLVSSLIERKFLFEFIKASGEFELERPELYTNCLEEWRQATRDVPTSDPLLGSNEDKERLKRRICEWDIIKTYLTNELYNKVNITDLEVAHYFEAHHSEFRKGPRVVIQQIVLASEKKANKIRNMVNSHNFGKLAAENSITPEAAHQGRLGPFANGDMPQIFNVAFSMRIGEVRGVLKSTYGFHIIRLEKKLPRLDPVLADVEGLIRQRVRKQKEEEEYQKWLELALSTVSVESPKPLW